MNTNDYKYLNNILNNKLEVLQPFLKQLQPFKKDNSINNIYFKSNIFQTTKEKARKFYKPIDI